MLLFVVLFPCCYTLKQGGIMLGYLHSAEPLESLLTGIEQDSEEYQKNKIFVDNINSIRKFAIEDLGLKSTKNYTKYVEIDRDYLAAIVSASEKLSFKRHEWHFPIVGAVPYKGFFTAKDAQSEAQKLSKKNLDVWIRQVDAFSTLGFFSDPLYSYMKEYPIDELADLIIHESMHATVFVKGDMNFNEELAEIVGTEGARLYMEYMYGKDAVQIQARADRKADSKTFVNYVQDLIPLLDVIYKSDISDELKTEQKEITIKNFQEKFAMEYDKNFKTDSYKNFASIKINNAYLELFRLYYNKSSDLKMLYETHGSDIKKFITAAKTIKGRKLPIEQLRNAL
ncbi:MAG: aminopeptidase [Termitinemataceae bacterium]|nr:MAG: aminopeptidase [Termitinemataceae bacterium]